MSLENIYQYTYLFIVAIFLINTIGKSRMPLEETINNDTNYSPLCLFLIIILSIVIGNRPITVGADTTQYMQIYHYLQGMPFRFDWQAENIIFDNLMAFVGSLNLDIWVLFTFISVIYFGGIYIACKKIFPQNQEIAFLSCLLAFSTFSYATNGFKAGAGASIFLLALSYRDNKLLSILFALMSIGIHHSMIVPVYAYVISFFYRNTRMYFFGWLFATFLAIAHVSFFQELFAGFTDERGKGYLTGDGYLSGFRPDFILYSAAPIIVGYMMLFKYNIRNEIYELWLRMYLVTNSVWMLCMYASFTNRIAYLSWFMFPIVMFIPYYAIYTSDNQLITGKKIAIYHMAFTFFMELVYYGFVH